MFLDFDPGPNFRPRTPPRRAYHAIGKIDATLRIVSTRAGAPVE
jgi:hypothetical protein